MTKILIVDDEPEVRNLLAKTTRRRGWIILSAENVQEALTVAQEESPDLVIMDIIMPGSIDGIEATRILKADSSTARSMVIILTGKEGLGVQGEAVDAGADAFFSKPFSPLDLLLKIDEILESRFVGETSCWAAN